MSSERISDHDPRVMSALAELQMVIRQQYPAATFAISHGEDPEGMYLTAMVDIEDTDMVVDLVIDRLVAMQVEESLPIYLALMRLPAQASGMRQQAV